MKGHPITKSLPYKKTYKDPGPYEIIVVPLVYNQSYDLIKYIGGARGRTSQLGSTNINSVT